MAATVCRVVAQPNSVTVPRLLRSLQRSLGLCMFAPEVMLCRDAVVFETPPLGTAWLAWGVSPARVVVWHADHHAWRDALQAVKQRAAFFRIWIVAGGVEPAESWMSEAWSYGIALVWTPMAAEHAWYRIHSAVFALAPAPEYGTVVHIKKQGVLICGAAGTGKSSLARTLVAAGHALVADDAPILERASDGITATCPAGWQGLLRVGAGPVRDVRLTYGAHAFVDAIRIRMIVHLIAAPDLAQPKYGLENNLKRYSQHAACSTEALPEIGNYQLLLTQRLPMRVVPAHQPGMGLAVVAAVERIILLMRPGEVITPFGLSVSKPLSPSTRSQGERISNFVWPDQ